MIDAESQEDRFARAAALSAEIATRLAELDEIDASFAPRLVHRLSQVHSMRPEAWPIIVSALTGNTTLLCSSFEEQASTRGVCKQAIHAEWGTSLRVLGSAFPELSATLDNLREWSIKCHTPIVKTNHTFAGQDATRV